MKEMVSGPLANVFVAWRIEKKSKCSLSPSELLFIMFPSKRYQDSLLQDYIYLKQVSQRDWKKTKVVFLTEQLQNKVVCVRKLQDDPCWSRPPLSGRDE